ncbi:MAG: hypothetical protein HQL71_11465 [Magnetococcales bacterium]|nr:hypothetical protein [Magnetococcales bacterium]
MSDNRPVVFLIHGMGVHKAGWEVSWIDSMQETLKNSGYTYFQTNNIKNTVDFCPINYDSIFVDLLGGWSNTATKVMELKGMKMAGELSDAVNWAADINKSDSSFIRDSVLDVLLWRLGHVTRNDIINEVATQITEKLLTLTPQRRSNCHVISHSLGTSVIDRVLDAIATNEWQNGAPSGFDSKKFRFNSVHTLANVSLILETKEHQIAQSMVRPANTQQPLGYTQVFCNYKHKLDPFTLLKPLNAGELFNEKELCNDIAISHIHDANVHAFSHYFKHPSVHQSIVNNLLPATVSYIERMSAKAAFKHTNIVQTINSVGLTDEAKVLQELTLINEMIESEIAEGSSLLKVLLSAIYLYEKGNLK